MKDRRQGVNIESGPFIVTVSKDEHGKREVFFVSRAKLGGELDLILRDMFIQISKELQDEND